MIAFFKKVNSESIILKCQSSSAQKDSKKRKRKRIYCSLGKKPSIKKKTLEFIRLTTIHKDDFESSAHKFIERTRPIECINRNFQAWVVRQQSYIRPTWLKSSTRMLDKAWFIIPYKTFKPIAIVTNSGYHNKNGKLSTTSASK